MADGAFAQPDFSDIGNPGGGTGSILDDQHPLGAAYETHAGPILESYDRVLLSQKNAAFAAQRAATATQAAAQTAAKRHQVAVQALNSQDQSTAGSAFANSEQSQRKRGVSTAPDAFTQPPLSLTDWLKTHQDEDVDSANAEVKKMHGTSADEMYDKLVADKFITPPRDQELTKRQKSEAFIHMGLEMLRNSTSKNRWTQNPAGALAEGAEAGLGDIKQARQENYQQAAQRAHDEYAREQGIGEKKAAELSQREKEGAQQERQLTAQRRSEQFQANVHEYDQAAATQRERERSAEEDRREAARAGREAQQHRIVDDEGYYRDATTGKRMPDPHKPGSFIKAQRSAEDETKSRENRAKFLSGEADKAKSQMDKETAWIGREDSPEYKAELGRRIQDATNRYDTQPGQQAAGSNKRVSFNDLPGG